MEPLTLEILESAISEVADQFDDHFTFIDHALDIEFTDKNRLIELFHKSRELFQTVPWRLILRSRAEITPLQHGSSRQLRSSPMDPALPLSDCLGRFNDHKR